MLCAPDPRSGVGAGRVLAAVGASVIAADMAGTVTYCNEAAAGLFGWRPEEAVGRPIADVTCCGTVRDPEPVRLAVADGGWVGELTLRRRDGSPFPALVTAVPVRDERGGVDAVVEVCLDITPRRRVEQELEDQNALHLGILETAQEGIWLIDPDGRTVFANAKLAEILQTPLEQILLTRAEDWVPPQLRAEVSRRRQERAASGHEVYELPFLRAGGETRWALISASPLFVRDTYRGSLVMMSDVTERKCAEAELERRAMHDELTGLPNRALLVDRLEQALRERHRPGSLFVLFVDLDDFKLVNDSYGHAAGDSLIVQVSERLQRVLRSGDTLARFAGDEFVIVCPQVEDPVYAQRLAERVVTALERPFLVDGQLVTVSASVGVASDSMRTADADALVRNADAAMFQAKLAGRGRHVVFDATVGRDSQRRLRRLEALRSAVARHEFTVHYQPQVDLVTGLVTGVEALVRWQRSKRTLYPPSLFLDLAESTGIVVPLGRQVLATACAQAAAWVAVLPVPVPVAVNVSARELDDDGFVDAVRQAIAAVDLDPRLLRLEIRETPALTEAAAAPRALSTLQAEGVRVSIDDFGTGYSTLRHLKQLPVEEVKIDRAFVGGVGKGGDDTSIVEAVVRMAHAFHLRVVAEGVETAEQEAALRTLRCDAAQGFRYRRPASAEEITDWLLHQA